MLILENLWWGDTFPSEQHCRWTADFAKRAKAFSQRETAFCEKLSDEDMDTYDQIHSFHNEICAKDACDAFVRGFRMGGQVILDVLGRYDPLPREEEERD